MADDPETNRARPDEDRRRMLMADGTIKLMRRAVKGDVVSGILESDGELSALFQPYAIVLEDAYLAETGNYEVRFLAGGIVGDEESLDAEPAAEN